VETLPTIEEALALVLARVVPLGPEAVDLDAAAGRVLGEPVRAAIDLPPFRSSAMDGFALRAGDAPGTLRVVGQSAAGRPWPDAVRSGEAVAISTGAVVPDDTDAVVPIEVVRLDGDRVEVDAVAKGDNVREPGGDVAAGAVVLEAGTMLGSGQLGAAAAAGAARVVCVRRPRVVVLPTGNELRPPGSTLAPGEIFESNGLLLATRAAEAGAEVERLAPAADEPGATRAALERALQADVVVTSGGVSVGRHDLVRATLAELGAEEVFWRVAVKPGKPVAFGVRGSTLIFGLPGNPVSSLVAFELFVRPALRALQGAAPGPRFLPARLGAAVRRVAGRDQLVRAVTEADGESVVVRPLRGQDSHMIVRAATADALVLVPQGEGELAAGSAVTYVPV
jgi:molybdopterin molybdotransferase